MNSMDHKMAAERMLSEASEIARKIDSPEYSELEPIEIQVSVILVLLKGLVHATLATIQ